MPTYNVHVYRELRIRFESIEAATPGQAAAIADRQTLELSDYEHSVHDCEGVSLAALVDVAGDEEHAQSQLLDFGPGRLLKAAPELRAALRELVGAVGGLPITLLPGPFYEALRRARAALALAEAA